MRKVRKGLAQEVLSGPDGAADAVTAEPLRTIATKVNHILEILRSGNGVGSLASANVATGEPTVDPATLEAESAALRANLLAAYGIEPLAEDNIPDAKGAPE